LGLKRTKTIVSNSNKTNMKSNFTSFLKFSLIAFSMAGLVFITGCSDDDEVDPLVGTYALTNATVAEALTITLPGASEPATLPAGTPITELVAGILAAASPCENPANAAVELGADGTYYYKCIGEDVERVDSGEWNKGTDTNGSEVLTLIIVSESLGQTITVVVTDLVITGTTFSGRIDGFPAPIDANQAFGAPLTGTDPPVLNFQFASINATFTKLP
jgi:hypothetical protein